MESPFHAEQKACYFVQITYLSSKDIGKNSKVVLPDQMYVPRVRSICLCKQFFLHFIVV